MTNPMGPGSQFGPGGPMNANNMAPRHLSPQALEHQKLLQQQMLRAQQVQQHVRPPPPDYKTTAGMMQGMQPRYTGVPPNVRRCLQPMPPSGKVFLFNSTSDRLIHSSNYRSYDDASAQHVHDATATYDSQRCLPQTTNYDEYDG